MVDSGSQVVLCDLPVRLDTYDGCAHGCAYCFARAKRDIDVIKPKSGRKSVENFISGTRGFHVNWCDWDIPIHWGALSDPFQPIEKEKKVSLGVLEVFVEHGYPFVLSTKSVLPLEAPYRDLFERSNGVIQVSMVSPKYDKIEPGAPTFEDRMAALPGMAEISKRLIIRVQPYALGLVDDVLEAIPRYASAGVYGLTIEGMKRARKRKGMVRSGGDMVYPVESLVPQYWQIKRACYEAGMSFYCAENRLRSMGDSPTCCGVDGLPGFVPNRANMNHMNSSGEITYTEHMHQVGTAGVFKAIAQSGPGSELTKISSYRDMMEKVRVSVNYLKIMGLK